MSYRSAPWRRSCPEIVGKTIDEALRATIYIVHEAGPTGFVLKHEGEAKKVKVTRTKSEIIIQIGLIEQKLFAGVSW